MSSSSCLPFSSRAAIWTFRVFNSVDRDLFLALEASSFFFTSSWAFRRPLWSTESLWKWVSLWKMGRGTFRELDFFYIHFTHLKCLPLFLFYAANVAKVPFLRRGCLQEPHTMKIILHTRLLSLGRLVQLLLKIPQLSHTAFQSVCQLSYISNFSELWIK